MSDTIRNTISYTLTPLPKVIQISLVVNVPHPEGPPPTVESHYEQRQQSLDQLAEAVSGLLPPLFYRIQPLVQSPLLEAEQLLKYGTR
jgi:hypothetical protein